MSQDNLTGANILDCTAQYKTFTSDCLCVLVTEEVTKYLPRDTDVPAEVQRDSGETNVHTRYWPWRSYTMRSTSRNPSSPPAEILPLSSIGPAKPSSASTKPLFVWVIRPFRILHATCPGAVETQELLLTRVQGGWRLDTADTIAPEGRDPIKKRAMSLHVRQAHAYALQRNPVLKKHLPVLPHFPRALSSHRYRISARIKATSSVLGCHGFPCFLMGPC